MTNEMRELVLNDERYKDFTLFEKGIPFLEWIKDKGEVKLIQVHDITPIEKIDFCGFCGVFAWNGSKIESLDGDCYNEDMEILGFDTFDTTLEGKEIKAYDILVGSDW